MRQQNKKSKFVALLLSLLLVCTMMPQLAWATGALSVGTGTADDPYQISNTDDLKAFRDKVNGGERTACAILTQNIDLKGETWMPFAPKTGYVADAFAGTFDGNRHTIKGLNINATAANQGLFGLINGATIKNLKVEGTVYSTGSYVGGIVGKVQTGTIENCGFGGSGSSVRSEAGYAGGIVGGVVANGISITGCYNNASVKGNSAAGILGDANATKSQATITNCYNRGTIEGKAYSAGIVGALKKGNVSSCYNIGTISGTESCKLGGIFGFSKATITNCYYKNPETDSSGGGTKITEASEMTNLGDAFTADRNSINNGYPILAWQAGSAAVQKEPKITISGSTTLYMENNEQEATSTLTVNYTDIDDAAQKPVTWSIESGAEVITLTYPSNPNDKNTQAIITAKRGGKAKITATAGAYKAESDVLVVPYITTVQIQNVNGGAVAAGQTVEAKVNVEGGTAYDETTMPPLTYQWYKYNTSPAASAVINGATQKTYDIPADYDADRIQVEVSCGGKIVKNHADTSTPVESADKGKLYPVAYDPAFTLPTDIKEAMTLELKSTHSKDGVTANIEWSSDNALIDATTGVVTLPQAGKETVELTAKFTYNNVFYNRTFDITVWSQDEVDKDFADKQKPLKAAVDALGNSYTMHPVCGKDTNVNAVLQAALAAKGHTGITAKVKKVEEVYGGAGISAEAGDANGAITYFYADPNTDRSVWFGSYKVTFELAKDDVTYDYADVPVILYWDRGRVEDTMKSEILDKVTAETIRGTNTDLTNVTQNLVLPKVVDGKKWTQISWTSSNEQVISISNQNQTSADTLFNPYVGVVKQGAADQDVTLTAKFTFQRTNDTIGGEEPIVLYLTYDVTVKAISGEQAEAIRADLQAKLEAGFTTAGITDAVTGKVLTEADGVYTASNDIKIPTTKDFGVDGKYYPVITTTTNSDLLEAPDVNNAARISVIRPAVDQAAGTADVTVSIYDKNTSVSASKTFTVHVPALTQNEIDSELRLMEQAKAHYFDGIKAGNADTNNIISDLKPFTEVRFAADGSNLQWVYSTQDMEGYGIVPEALDGWQTLEIWRQFKSSNAAVVSHENLLVSRQKENKAVTISSALSSETLGKYGKLYKQDPAKHADYKELAPLYYQEVSADLIVAGTAPTKEGPVSETLTVSFTLNGNDGNWIAKKSYSGINEGSTAFDVFQRALKENNYTYAARGSYVYRITKPNGTAVGEFTEGKDSGWMYRVNGVLPSVYLAQYPLHNGDDIEVFYTKNWTTVPGVSGMGEQTSDVTTSGASGSATTTAPTDVKVSEKTNADGTKETVAEVKVDSKHHDEIIKQAAEKKSAEIVLEVSKADSKGADNVQLMLDVTFVKNVADKTNADLTVNTENGKVTLDQETIKTVLDAAKGATITLEVTKVAKPTEAQKKAAGANGHVISLTVKSGNQIISDFNKGKATVMVELVSRLIGKKVAAIHIADDGTIEQLTGKLLTVGGKQYYEFMTPHFSTFAIVDADEVGLDAAEEPAVDAKALASKLTPAARSAKTAKKNVKVTTSLDKQDKEIISQLKAAGYTVKYRFYRSTKKAAGYKAAVTKKASTYTSTSGKKGTKYFYKVQVRVYDASGKLAAKTALKQCRYASRTWNK